ncbi:MAG: DUF58 domain-containing protein [Rhizobiaceae bacterium]
MRRWASSLAFASGPDTATQISLDDLIALRGAGGRISHQKLRGVTALPGLANTRLRGRGLDFDEMRPYAEGDDVRHIDWNVTARTGRPYTRLYREERERSITVCLDLRRSMFTGSARLKAVVACEIAAAILWRVASNGDRAAAMVFDDHVIETSRPALRERGVLDGLALVERIFQAGRKRIQQDMSDTGSLAGALASINRMGRHGSVALLVSDCDRLDAAAVDEIAIAGLRQRLVVMRLLDPLEESGLPAGSYRYLAPAGPTRVSIDDKLADALRVRLRQFNDDMAAAFARHAIRYLAILTSLDPTDAWPSLVEQGLV